MRVFIAQAIFGFTMLSACSSPSLNDALKTAGVLPNSYSLLVEQHLWSSHECERKSTKYTYMAAPFLYNEKHLTKQVVGNGVCVLVDQTDPNFISKHAACNNKIYLIVFQNDLFIKEFSDFDAAKVCLRNVQPIKLVGPQ
jgi:hypothetical protein